ncbi:hypothetical protein [Alteribacillus sp. HJP-4]|uniref:hypothetical protein n=1 Tax=Alteribacillus sp. HJP-4 TaxID=2775394 RepID=UPI0035CCEA41
MAIENTKSKEQGDLALHCISLDKILNKSPLAITLELANKIQPLLFETYLNGFLNKKIVSKAILETILMVGKNCGSVLPSHIQNDEENTFIIYYVSCLFLFLLSTFFMIIKMIR